MALSHDRKVLGLALLAGLPAVLTAMYFVAGLPARLAIPLGGVLLGTWLGCALYLRSSVIRPLATLSNLLAGVREGDFSVRARGAGDADPLGLTLLEINALAETLREQRLGAREATALLETVMDAIDVAVLAFDPEPRLRLVNAAGAALLGRRSAQLLGLGADELGLGECFEGPTPRTVEITGEGGPGRWELRRNVFRQGGEPMTLIVLADPGRILREQERQAWRRLIRVLSHEINNSLAPISSIVDSLQRMQRRAEQPEDWAEDLHDGLDVIGKRAAGLQRFMEGYARLARLPSPVLGTVDVVRWVERIVALESRLEVKINAEHRPSLELRADGDQLDQLLINVVRNAVDASLENQGSEVEVGWQRGRENFVLWVRDDGPGISDSGNLFVPFFSTKPQGSGIGLVLSQQIAEAHGGSLTLRNRSGGGGAELRLELPLLPLEAAESQNHMRVSV